MTGMFVVDLSAAIFALTEPSAQADELMMRLAEAECHAPHLYDAEIGSVMRRNLRQGTVDEDVAESAIQSARYVVDERYPHTGPFATAAWDLRGSITFYDALYVALAASLDVPLLTAEARLARAPKLPCEIEVVA